MISCIAVQSFKATTLSFRDRQKVVSVRFTLVTPKRSPSAFTTEEHKMSYTGIVYQMWPGGEGDYPTIDLARNLNDEVAWDALDEPFPEDSDTILCDQFAFRVDHPRSNEWDWYGVHRVGLMSERACCVLWKYLSSCCNRCCATINGSVYYLMLEKNRYLDCVDYDNSIYEKIDGHPRLFSDARRLRFRYDRLADPLIFQIEEYGGLYVTSTIRRIVEGAGLNGFEFVDCEHLRVDA
jgi:hypothetical protein